MSHEIELKFQVPAERLTALRRAVGGRGSRRLVLAARYFDTADERLARGRAALRLRLEGERKGERKGEGKGDGKGDGKGEGHGQAWVQTLKAEGAHTLQRLEHNVPLPPAVAPAELPPGTLPDTTRHQGHPAGERLQALLGDAPLTEQYRTTIRRTTRRVAHQGAVLELALDEGEIVAGAQRLPVCELEIELVEGPLAALLDLAGAWAARHGLWIDVRSKSERGHRLAALDGALARGEPPPPWPVASARAQPLPADRRPDAVARAWVAQALTPALANAAVLADGPQARPEHLHQLRVALRRLRTLFRHFGAMWPAGALAAPGEDLAALFRALGAARDADVLAGGLAQALAEAGAPAAALPAPAEGQPAVALLRTAEAQRLWLALMALAWVEPRISYPAPVPAHSPAAPPTAAAAAPQPALQADNTPLADQLTPPLRRLDRQVRRAAARSDSLDDEGLHRLRRRIKQLRYALDSTAALWPARPLARRLKRLAAAQEALGDLNDLLLALADSRARAAQVPEAWFAVGWLSARLAGQRAAAARPLARLAALKSWPPKV